MPRPRSTDAEKRDRRDFVERLKTLTKMVGGTRLLARAAGVGPSTAHAWFRDSEPTRPVLAAISRGTSISLDWLVTGSRGDPILSAPTGYVSLLFFDLAKHGGFVPHPDELLFKADWLWSDMEAAEKELRQDPVNRPIAVVAIGADGMSPVVANGDILVLSAIDARRAITESRRSVTFPALYNDQGHLRVRLFHCQGRPPKRTVSIGAVDPERAPAMGPVEKTLEAASPPPNLLVIGAVIWRGTALRPPRLCLSDRSAH